jgi:hypothetical protein
MPEMPQLEGQNRLKPLSYDPKTGRFITYDEIISGRAKIVPLDQLSPEQLKNLVLQRQRVGPDYTMSDLNGRAVKRDEIVQQIINDTEFGRMVMKAEIAYLREFLNQIQQALSS